MSCDQDWAAVRAACAARAPASWDPCSPPSGGQESVYDALERAKREARQLAAQQVTGRYCVVLLRCTVLLGRKTLLGFPVGRDLVFALGWSLHVCIIYYAKPFVYVWNSGSGP
eukprot:3421041-Pyramimonas_sp.AAC.1